MQPAIIQGHTDMPGAPANWDAEKHGRCGALAIRAEEIDGLPWMRSAWQPNPNELASLNAGACVELGVAGRTHPVVSVGVGPVPVDGDAAQRVSMVLTLEEYEGGSKWCRVVGRFGAIRFPAGMELSNPEKTGVTPIAFEEACSRLVNAVMCHARSQGWVE